MQTAQLLKYSTLSQYQRGISISSSDRSNTKSDATSLRCYQPLFFEMLSTPIFEMLSTPIFWDAINPYFASSSNSQKKYQTCLHNVDNKLYSNSFLLTTKLFNKNNKKYNKHLLKPHFQTFYKCQHNRMILVLTIFFKTYRAVSRAQNQFTVFDISRIAKNVICSLNKALLSCSSPIMHKNKINEMEEKKKNIGTRDWQIH